MPLDLHIEEIHSKGRKLCIHCVYAMKIYPGESTAYWECGNPAYVTFDPVEGHKTFESCASVRSLACGLHGAGFLPKIPEEKRCVTMSASGAMSADPASSIDASGAVVSSWSVSDTSTNAASSTATRLEHELTAAEVEAHRSRATERMANVIIEHMRTEHPHLARTQ
jgi:hypothetical protein